MQVFLEAIQFNHDRKFTTTGTFDLRRNENAKVTVPEWRQDSCSTPECSPVAYATMTVPSPITILASFVCDDVSVTSLKVQALSNPSWTETGAGVTAANVLGNIPEHNVPLQNGRSGFVPLKLTNAKIREAGIGIHDITWYWQFCVDSGNWLDFQTTRHRVYTVPLAPSKPWEPRLKNPSSSNIHLPWTEVLDFACLWAAGVKDNLDEAAKRVTENVYNLGKTLVKYAGGAEYAHGKFKCTEFLKLLKTGIGIQTMNCDDCATVVSTFANILGCDLHQSAMGFSFQTNPILPISAEDDDWNPTTFLYHAVAWKGACRVNDPLFDGCFRVDVDGTPDAPPQVAFQPVNFKFGEFEDEKYKFCFVKKDAPCQPIPNSQKYGRKRRPLGRSFLADESIIEEGLVDLLREIYEFDTWPPVEPPNKGATRKRASPAKLFNPETIFPEWQFYEGEHLENERFRNVSLLLFKRDSPHGHELLAINLYECREVTDPNNFLLQVLGSFEQLTLTRLRAPSIGNVSFQKVGGLAVLFRRDRFVGVVRSASRRRFSVTEVAFLLDQILII